MAEFLTTNGTSHCIEQIILKATKKLVLVTPYLQLSKTLSERLMDASNRGVNIKIIYGKSELVQRQKDELFKLKNLDLYFFENLHAKCYFNEKNMVITSMNMYEFSEKNNREMGISIDRITDRELFENAVNETLSIVKSAKQEIIQKETVREKIIVKEKDKVPEPPKQRKPVQWINESARKLAQRKEFQGFCVRCNTQIKKNPEKPFCRDCYDIWDTYGNEDFEEKYCHTCGELAYDISMRKPLCYNCFRTGKWDN